MPTVNPRITITLEPSVHAVLRRVSELTGGSMSSMIGELLKQSEPVFTRMVRVMEAAVAARESLSTEMVESLDRAQAKLEGQLGLAIDDMDEGFRPILEEAERVKRRAAGAGGARLPRTPAPAARRAARTPLSNRGVTPLPGKAKKAAKKGGGHGPV